MASDQTSDIQKRIYDFIVNYIRREGMPPTNREIGSAMSIASTGHVDYHLSMLEKKGYILRESKKSRGIKLSQPSRGIPIMGSIAAGEPIEVLTEQDHRLAVGEELGQQSTYALVVKVRSMMEDHICDGDYVVMKRQTTSENCEIAGSVREHDNGRA